MVCAFIIMKCEGFSQITDLVDYPDNNRLIAHCCGFNIMEPLPSYWTYDRFLRQLDNAELKTVMADLVRQLYELGVVDASFIGLDSTAAADILAAADQTIPTDYSFPSTAAASISRESTPCARSARDAAPLQSLWTGAALGA